MTGAAGQALLEVDSLEVGFTGYGRRTRVLDDVSLEVAEGERVAVIGQSGSGKTVTMRAIVGTLPVPPADIAAGSIRFDGTELLSPSPRERERRKGSGLSIVLQDPLLSFNPVLTIGRQMDDVVRYADARAGRSRTRGARRAHLVETLRRVQLPDGARVLEALPMQLSGGMRQRVLIATALLNGPRLLIADEPGTALDVTTQREILDLLDSLVTGEGLSLLLITHNLGVVREAADRVYVMHRGRIVESGTCARVFADPEAEYTRALMASVPPLYGPRVRALPPPASEEPLLRVEGVSREFVERRGLFGRDVRAVRAVDAVELEVRRGEVFGLAGESGSGKTTLARMALGLLAPSAGTLSLDGTAIPLAGDALDLRRRVQLVHQNPGSSLNPRRTVAQQLAVPLGFAGLGPGAVRRRVPALLEEVELPAGYASKYPHELSGGQKQRVAIARALSVGPELLVLDEPTSALDVLVQERIVALLLRLRAERDLTYLFISHDLGLMRNLCHRIAIMRRGAVCELGPTARVFAAPAHPYTRALIASIPVTSAEEAALKPVVSADERSRVLADRAVRSA